MKDRKKHERVIRQIDPASNRTKDSGSMTTSEMMARYNKENDLMPIAQQMPMYGDFSNVPDFQSALDQVRNAEAMFLKLPSKIRSQMDNSPHKFIEWIQDPENLKEAIELGLLADPDAKPPRTAPTEVVMVNPDGTPFTGIADGSVSGGE